VTPSPGASMSRDDRDYDRRERRRDYDYDDRDRSHRDRRDDYDDRDRSRDYRDRNDRDRDRDRNDRDDRKSRKKRGWDDMGEMPQAATQLMLQQQQQFAQALTMPMAPMQSNKKQRELYVGNVPTGMVTEAILKDLFAQMLSSCEGYNAALGPPVLNVQLCGGGTYAFVEFRDEELCETAMLFTGMELSGRQLKINHPNGYFVPPIPVPPLKPPNELLQKFNIATGGANGGGVAPEVSRKARELYIGNLTTGAVTNDMVKELFTVPLQTIPDPTNSSLPPVLDAKVDLSGKFAFVEFRDEEITTLALSLFNNMELCGRPMHVARPAGFVPAVPDVPGAGIKLPELPATATPAPPPLPLAEPQAAEATPTSSLCLENLLTAEIMASDEEFKECFEDIRSETEQYGKILSFEIPRGDKLGSHPAEDAGKCFVRYELVSSAVKAFDALNGRDFDGNTVKASFLPVEP